MIMLRSFSSLLTALLHVCCRSSGQLAPAEHRQECQGRGALCARHQHRGDAEEAAAPVAACKLCISSRTCQWQLYAQAWVLHLLLQAASLSETTESSTWGCMAKWVIVRGPERRQCACHNYSKIEACVKYRNDTFLQKHECM